MPAQPKKTKIVATIGPATENPAVLARLFSAGVNVVRLNFSHGDHLEHGRRISNTRAVAKKLDLPIAILQDLAGPKIRIGDFYQERVELTAGKLFILTTEKIVGDEKRAWINYPKLPQEVKVGGIIFLDDGKKKLRIERIKGQEIYCRILVGGTTKGRRGVNVPGAYLSISSLTAKDRVDAAFGIKRGVDYMAISFVRRASDILELRRILAKGRASQIKIIAKIETEEAIENLDEIIAATDGVMVARGDLAIEIPAEDVPIHQKQIIKKCNALGKPVITATQMLESMIHSPVPTRAEVNDIANAIFDGTDAVMLSEETTLGEYPLAAVEVMSRVAARVEDEINHSAVIQSSFLTPKNITDSFSYAAVARAHELGAACVVVLTKSGKAARMVARHRPPTKFVALTSDEKTYHQLALTYGCIPVQASQFKTLSALTKTVKRLLLKQKLAAKGELVMVVAGLPFGQAGVTNLLLAERV